MKLNVSKMMINLIFIYLLFVKCWERIPYIGEVLSHIDELLVILLFGYVVCHLPYIYHKKKKIVIIWSLFWTIGCFSSIVGMNQKLIPSLIDGIVIINRFVLGYFASIIYFRKHDVNESFMYVKRTSMWIVFVLSIIGIHDFLFDPWFSTGEKVLGFASQAIIFGHPTYLAFAGVTLLVLSEYIFSGKNNIIYKLMITLLIFFSFRLKAIVFVILYWFLFLYFYVLKQKKIVLVGCVSLILGIFIAREKIVYYFFGGASFSPRLVLIRESLTLAKNNFPLGTGFGSFGSSIAAQFYSPIYYALGFTNLDGMGKNGSTTYLCDSFWPCILAQFGFIGCFLFIVFVCLLLYEAITILSRHKKIGFPMLMIVIYLLIASVAETSFFNPAAFLISLILGALSCEGEVK